MLMVPPALKLEYRVAAWAGPFTSSEKRFAGAFPIPMVDARIDDVFTPRVLITLVKLLRYLREPRP